MGSFRKGKAMSKKDIILDLSIDDNKFGFSTSVNDALVQAEAELAILNETVVSIKELKPNCDKLDYILAAACGALCGVIDIFLVEKPEKSPLGEVADEWFAARTIDFATLCHPDKKHFDSLKSALQFLEKEFNVPYDQTGLGDAGREVFGLTPTNHHFKSLAHNPSLLGLFFSILNQFTNTSHFVTDGQLVALSQANEKWELQGGNIPAKLYCGFVNWFGHLISDVSGSSGSKGRGMGIPSPFWVWTNDIIVIKRNLGITPNEADKAINELALNIFQNGYDTRFQAVQVIPVFLNELLVRFVYAIRRLFRYFSETAKAERSLALMWKSCEPFSNPTVKRMLTVAHGTFCLIDVGEAAARGFVSGFGVFNAAEFVLHLNIVGVGRFAVSLYGESKRVALYGRAKQDANFALEESRIIKNYIAGLRMLSVKYDDAELLTFIDDFQKSDAYTKAFAKSVALAELRKVPTEKILKNKSDIDRYFGG